jgi:magnesium transporter
MVTPEALLVTPDDVKRFIAENATDELKELLVQLHPADIADLLDNLDEQERLVVFKLLDTTTAAEVLDEALDDTTFGLIEAVPDERIADLLEILPMDDAAELLSELPPERSKELIALMEPKEATEVQTLLGYEDETAGRLMTEKVVRARRRWTVQETIEHLRHLDPEAETFVYLYTVDDDNHLTGVVPLRRLLTAPPDATLGELVEPDVIVVGVDTDQEEVARLVARYDLAAIPVLDREGHLAGIITHDDVVDIVAEETTEDIQRLGGAQPLEHNYLATRVTTVVRKRIGWLLLLFITETLTGSVIRLYAGEIEKVVALSFFIPLLIGTGGNAGSQTTSTITRALATEEITLSDALRVWWHEGRVGLFLGLGMGVVAFIRALTWGAGDALALTVALAIMAIVLWANNMGSLLPLLAVRLGIDPAIVSGPMMSTLVDATGLLIYFSIARIVLGL